SVITARGDFRADFTAIRLDRLSLQRAEESLPRVAYSAVDPRRFGIAFATSPGQQIYVNGLELSPSDIIVFRAGSEGHNRSLAACRWASFSLTHEDVTAAGQTIIGCKLSAPPITQAIKPPPPLLSGLLSLHKAASQLGRTTP